MGLMSVQQGMRQQQEFDDKRAAQDLAGQLLENPDMQIDPKKYSPNVAFMAQFLKSQAEAAKLSASNETLRQKALTYESQLAEDMPRINKIVGLANSSDEEGFYKAAEDFYNTRIYDGAKVKFLPENKMEITEKDGSIRIVARPDKDDILKTLSFYQDPKNYISVNLHLDNEIIKSNAEAISKAEQLYDAKGNPLGVAVTYLTDPKTKKAGIVYFDSYTGQPVDIDQYKKNGLLTDSQLKNSLDIMSKRLGLQIGAQNLMNSRLEFGLKVLEGENKSLEIKKKRADLAGKATDIDKIYKGIKDYFEVIPGGINKSGELVKVDRNTATAIREYARRHGGDARFRTFEDGTFAFEKVIPFKSDENVTVVKQGGAGLMSGDSPAGNGTVVQPRLPGESIEKWAERTGGLSGKPEKPGAQSKQPKGVSGKPINSSKKRNYASQYLNSGKEGKDYLKKTITDMYGPQGWEAVLQEAEALKKEREKIKKDTGKFTWNTAFGEREINLPVQGRRLQ